MKEKYIASFLLKKMDYRWIIDLHEKKRELEKRRGDIIELISSFDGMCLLFIKMGGNGK